MKNEQQIYLPKFLFTHNITHYITHQNTQQEKTMETEFK